MAQLKDKKLIIKVALKLKELRENKKITQEVFLNDTNIHIGRIEQGKQNITISTLKVICSYLGINLGDFFNEISE